MTGPIVVRGDARALPLPDESVHAIVCDPPYGLEFMGREWDSFRPGGKQPKMGAGDGTPFRRSTGTPSWQASGNPGCRTCGGQKYGARRCNCSRPYFGNHSADHNRAFQAWCEQWAVDAYRVLKPGGHIAAFGATRTYHRLACAVEDAGFEVRDSIRAGVYAWVHGQGFPKGKTQLKPAWEPIVIGRKPPVGTLVKNVEQYGTGPLGIDACRTTPIDEAAYRAKCASVVGLGSNQTGDSYGVWTGVRADSASDGGRWPTNLVLAHHPDCADGCVSGCHVAALDEQSGTLAAGNRPAVRNTALGFMNDDGWQPQRQEQVRQDMGAGGASRFYPTFRYEAKAPAWQRPQVDGRGFETVKPLDLMRWLVRLLTPPGGLVLDPFPGTGTTGQAAQLEGFRSVLVELEAAHLPFIRERLAQRVVVDRKTDEAVPVTPTPDGAWSLFELGDRADAS